MTPTWAPPPAVSPPKRGRCRPKTMGWTAVVIGLPRRLDGSPTDQTARVRRLAELLATELAVPITLQDERLTSHEADELLAQREHDWRKRKQQLDAMAAALILQDFLDGIGPRP